LMLVGSVRRRAIGRERLVVMAIAAMLVGYYGVYLVTPWDLKWHLEFSLVRLLLQLWPAALLAWGLGSVATGEPVVVGLESHRFPYWAIATILIGNAIVAVGIVSRFRQQLAVNELARTTKHGGVHVVIGAGWFEREQTGRDTWIWSKGDSTLLVTHDRDAVVQRCTLLFSIRGLARQMVTARLGSKVIWSAEIAEGLQSMSIPAVELSSSVAELRLTTNSAGVRETDEPAARALTFAIYNLTVE
jgi:hypothetical protein